MRVQGSGFRFYGLGGSTVWVEGRVFRGEPSQAPPSKLIQSIVFCILWQFPFCRGILLMDKILHDPKDPKLWELWYIPYNG